MRKAFSILLALLGALALWFSALWAALVYVFTDCVEAPVIWLLVAVGMELRLALQRVRGEA